MSPPPVVLVIAGSDPSGGAGVQADLRAVAVHGLYGAAVVTALTVQNTRGVHSVHPVDASLVGAQIAAVLDDFPVAAIKIGMLGCAAVARAVLAALRGYAGPVVLDPVLRASSGPALLGPAGLEILRDELLGRALLSTPNLAEALALLRARSVVRAPPGPPGQLQTSALLDAPSDVLSLARALAAQCGSTVLVTGGHAEGEVVVDALAGPDGVEFQYAGSRIETSDDHGTGCLLSTAIACALARGAALPEAVAHGRSCVRRGLREAARLGAGRGPVLLLALPEPQDGALLRPSRS